jgi:formyltetrahydrofolate hydrolase
MHTCRLKEQEDLILGISILPFTHYAGNELAEQGKNILHCSIFGPHTGRVLWQAGHFQKSRFRTKNSANKAIEMRNILKFPSNTESPKKSPAPKIIKWVSREIHNLCISLIKIKTVVRKKTFGLL